MTRWILFICLIIVGAWFLLVFQIPLSRSIGLDWKPEIAAAWGEAFGSFSALFAALGFVAVIWTLRLQQQQIIDSQNQQHTERFDSSFFQLLSLLREARREVKFRHSIECTRIYNMKRERQEGSDAFKAAWHEIYHWINDDTITHEQAAQLYEKYVHGRYESSLGPYFRILYTLLMRIKQNAALKDSDKIIYANLLRSQLTSFEIAVASTNGLSKVSKDFRALILNFRLLKYLPGRRREIMSRYYPAEAFEGRSELDRRLFFRQISSSPK